MSTDPKEHAVQQLEDDAVANEKPDSKELKYSMLVHELSSLQDAMKELMVQEMQCAPTEMIEVLQLKLEEYAQSKILDHALRQGDILPDFALSDGTGQIIHLADLKRASKFVLVTFFRGGWCPFCNLTLRMIRKYQLEFQARGVEVVAISPMTPDHTLSIVKQAGLNFHVLSDPYCEYAQTCHLAYELEEELRQFSSDLPDYNGNDDWILPVSATYVVESSTSKIVHAFLETDPSERADPQELLKILPPVNPAYEWKTLQEELDYEFSKWQNNEDAKNYDENCEDCPCNREEGVHFIKREINALKKAGMDAQALKKGDKAPDFKLLAYNSKNTFRSKGTMVDTKKVIKKNKPLIVTFFHGDWSPFCRIALQALQKYLYQFQAHGATLVAISSQPPEQQEQDDSKKLTKTVSFPLLYDQGNQVAKLFKLLYQMDCEMPGYDESKHKGRPPWPLPMAATYIIGYDVDGDHSSSSATPTILYSFVSCDFTHRAEPAEILAALEELTTKAESSSMSSTSSQEEPEKMKRRGPFSLRLGGWLPFKNGCKAPSSAELVLSC